jgi:PAS domain S-box-containing protein
VQTEEALRRSEERLELAIRGSADGLWDWDIITNEVWLAPRFKELLGFADYELPSSYEAWESRLHPEDRNHTLEALRKHLEENEPYDVEFRMRTKDGSDRWFHSRGQASRDQTGYAIRMSGSLRDITDRKQAEQKLRESEMRAQEQLAELELLYRTAPIGLCLVDKDLRYVRMNDQMAAFYGRPASEIIGSRIPDAIPELATKLAPIHRRVLQDGKSALNVEIRGATAAKHGVERHWLENYYPLKDRDGSVMGMSVVVQEITERIQTEDRLKIAHQDLERRVQERTVELTASNRRLNSEIAERERTQRILQSIAEGTSADIGDDFFSSLVCSLASTLNIRCAYVSESLDWPTTKSQVIAGWAYGRIIENFVYEVADTPCAQTLIGKITFFPRDLQQLFPKDKILAELNAESYCGLPIHSPSGQVIGHLSLVDDKAMDAGFSELPALQIFAARAAAELHRRRAEDQLEQMQAEFAHLNRVDSMGQMAAALAHEIDQPLGVIANDAQACLRGIRNGLLSASEIDEALKEVVSESLRAAEIIRRIRNFMTRREPQRSSVDINELVREVARLVGFDARRHKAKLRIELMEPLPRILVDRVQIQQVLVNLVRNAFDAMQETDEKQREAVIRTTTGDGNILVSVSDTGPGVLEETLSQMFDPYFSTKPNGVGMGLSISRSIVDWHGGRIQATSNPKQGLTFEFTIPVDEHIEFSAE